MSSRVVFPDEAWPMLRKALEHIASHPNEFLMDRWMVRMEDVTSQFERDEIADLMNIPVAQLPMCGTVGCLAGHIQLAAGDDPKTAPFNGWEAMRRLGIDPDSSVGRRLDGVFGEVDVASYGDLCDELGRRFVFPEPLPVVPAAVSSRVA